MNKPKSQRITPAAMSGEQIADAILYGTYTKTALWSFISRSGGADAAHAGTTRLQDRGQLSYCYHTDHHSLNNY